MKLRQLFRGAYVLSGPDQSSSHLSQKRGSSRSLYAALVVCCVAALLLTGCNDFNPNLGAAAVQSSEITQIVPSSRNAGCTSFTLDVMGAGFVNGASVQWNGQNQPTTYESGQELLATIDASNLVNSGASPVEIPITVSIPGQSQGNDLSNLVIFTVGAILPAGQTCPNPAAFNPQISKIDPTSGFAGTTSVTIQGTYFGGVQGTSTVTFGGSQATIAATTDWSATSVVATVPSGAPVGPDAVVVNVGGVTNSNQPSFTVLPPPHSTASMAVSSNSILYAGVGNPLSISSGARYIAYVATSADPATSGGPGLDQIFLHDTCLQAPGACTPQIVPVSVALDGAAPNGPSRAPAVSADGRFVAFASNASNLVSGDDNGVSDIFVRDTCVGAGVGCLPTTTRISVGPGGREANGLSSSPAISSDGRFVAFQSFATNLTLSGTGSAPAKTASAFLRDTCFGANGACTPSTTSQTSSSSQ